MFLEIPEIEGESQDAAFRNQIIISSFSWGVETASELDGSGTGGGTAKPIQQRFQLSKLLDAASTKIFSAATRSTAFPQMTLRVRIT